MKNLYFITLLLLIITAQVRTEPKNDECMNCHAILGDKLQAPADLYKNDIHYTLGLTCASCHGGDASTDDGDISMSKGKGFIGVPPRKERFLACVKCHADQHVMNKYGSKKKTDQYDQLKSSVHFRPTYNNQGPVADCVTCHSVHQIVRVTDRRSPVNPLNVVALCGSCHSSADYMKHYNQALPIDQVAKYTTSTHGQLNRKGDMKAAACASCHGSHNIRPANDPKSNTYPTNIPQVCSNCHSDKTRMAGYKIPTDQFEAYTVSVHGKALLEKGDLSAPSCNDCHGNHGAVPPGVESISKVCGSCHSLNMELFEQSVHKNAFDKKGLPECETCHGNHGIMKVNDQMLGVQKSSSCIKCHAEGDAGYNAAKHMSSLVEKLKAEEKNAALVLKQAEQKGMDVSESEFALKDVRQVLMQTRTNVHLMDSLRFKETIDPGFEITSSAIREGNAAVSDYYFRRKGLLVSTLIVTLLAAGLYFKIRRLDKNEEKDPE